VKQSRQQKYLKGLESKGLKKTCVIIPSTPEAEAEIHQLAAKRREAHLAELQNERTYPPASQSEPY
jgi:hypothetical protein